MDRNCEALLMDYAAGTLDEAHSILVASYLTLSPEGRRMVAECEALGAAMMAHGCDCATLSAGCLEQVLAKIDHGECGDEECGGSPCDPHCVEGCAPLPRPLSQAIAACRSRKQWRRVSASVEWMDFSMKMGGYIHVMRYGPGAAIFCPAYRESGVILVLHGGFGGADIHHGRGEMIFLEHGPMTADGVEGCVMLRASEQPVRYPGFLQRLLRGL